MFGKILSSLVMNHLVPKSNLIQNSITTVTNKDGIEDFNKSLEALSVDNARTRLVIFLLGNPHLLKGR